MEKRKPAILPQDHKRIVKEYQEYTRCLEGVVMVLAVACIVLGCALMVGFAKLQVLGVFG